MPTEYTDPKPTTDRDLFDLKAAQFTSPVAEGTLSSGQRYEIKLSAKSAVQDGLHLIITFPGRTDLTIDEHVDAFRAINKFASEIPTAREFGYRFAENFGGMLPRPEPHAHIIIPGSVADRARAPRLVDPWSDNSK